MKNSRQLKRNQRGQVVVFGGIVMTILIGMAGLVVNLGEAQLYKREAQNAADFASLAAAYSLYSGSGSTATATALANKVITADGFNANTQFAITYFDSSGASTNVAANVASVFAQVTDSNLNQSFSEEDHYAPITDIAHATANLGTANAASYTYPSTSAILTLASSGNGYTFTGNNSTIDISTGDFDVNSGMSVTGNSLTYTENTGNLRVHGSLSSTGSITYTPAAITGGATVADPYLAVAYPSISGGTGGSIGEVANSTPLTVNPGVYTDLSITGNNDVITMNPGVYVFTGSGLNITGNTDTLAGNGVMIYFTCAGYTTVATHPCASTGQSGAGVSLTGNTLSVNLTAPSASNNTYRNLLFFFDRNNTASINYTGNGTGTGTMTGVIYGADSAASITSNNSSTGLSTEIVTKSLSITGNNLNFTPTLGVGPAPAGAPPNLTG